MVDLAVYGCRVFLAPTTFARRDRVARPASAFAGRRRKLPWPRDHVALPVTGAASSLAARPSRAAETAMSQEVIDVIVVGGRSEERRVGKEGRAGGAVRDLRRSER